MYSKDHKHRPPMVLKKIGWIIGGVFLAVFLAFIFGYFVMLLWNWIMPLLFGLPEIDYWLAFGIIILGRLIFGGFGGGHCNHKDHTCENHHEKFYKSKFKKKFNPPFEKAKKWHHYDEYWNEEGEEAFNKFVEKKEGGSENPTEK